MASILSADDAVVAELIVLLGPSTMPARHLSRFTGAISAGTRDLRRNLAISGNEFSCARPQGRMTGRYEDSDRR